LKQKVSKKFKTLLNSRESSTRLIIIIWEASLLEKEIGKLGQKSVQIAPLIFDMEKLVRVKEENSFIN
jgi:hypothetical protein